LFLSRWLLCCCICVALLIPREAAFAAASGYSFSSTLRPYVPLSGATTLVLNPGDDDVLSSAQAIGFSFVYDGQAYTQFKVSSNGFITFNLSQTSTPPTNALASNVLTLAPLWDDLSVDAAGKVQYQVSGSAPTRVLTIEFVSMRWSKFAASSNANFQIKLYEGSNVVEFAYGVFGTPVLASASIGISDMLANASASSFSGSHFLSVTPGSPSTASALVENAGVSTLPEFGSGTLYSFTPASPIAVPVVTVGASGNYTSLQSAFTDLRDKGIAASLAVKILADYIPESPSNGITIDYIPGMSAANAVRLVVDAGVSKTISIANSAGVDYALRLRGVRYLTIDGSAGSLTIQNTGTNPSSAIKLMDGVQNCVITGVTLQAEGSTSTSANAVVNFGPSNTSNNVNITNSNNRITRCILTKATQRCANGVLFSGGGASPLNDGNRVDSCTITDWGVGTGIAQAGVVLGRGYSNTVVADNEIFMTGNVPSYATQAGLLLGVFANDASASFSILRNRIYDIKPNSAVTIPSIRGIRVFANASSPVSLVANNAITLDASSTTTLASGGTLYGISDEAAGSTNYYFNSVRIGGTQSSGGGTTAAFDRPSTGVTTLRNNIFYNARANSGTGSGKHYAIRRSSTTGTFSSNYNDLYVDGVGGLAGYTGVDQTTLGAWRTASGQDANSVAVNPAFVSALDLHVQPSSLVESRGIPVGGVTTDKDGDTRNATWPDLGLDEFTGSAPGAFSLLAPSNNATGQPVSGTLRWSSSAVAGGYDVYLDTASSPGVLVSVNQPDTSYAYANLQAGAVYYWRVKSRNALGQTDPATAPFAFTAGNVPAAPTNLAVTSVSSVSISLGWTDNAGTETGYRIYRSTSAAGPFAQVGGDQPANSVAFTNASLAPNSRYYYRVVAFNAGGESFFASRDTLTLPATPNAPAVTNILFTSLTVALDSTGNPVTTQFAVNESGSNLYLQANGTLGASPVWQTYTAWGRASGIAVSGLSRATTYQFRVKARNDSQVETSFGTAASATTIAPLSTFPYTADFEGTSDSLWTTAKNPTAGVPNPANDWVRGAFTKLGGPISGTKAWITKLTGTYSVNHLSSLVSPEFNFSTFTKAPTISFQQNYKTEIYQDAGDFEYSTDGGSSWVKLGFKGDTNGTNWYNNDSTGPGAPLGAPNWTSTSSGWKTSTYLPSVLIGKPLVQFRFRFGSDVFNSDSGWAVDKFQISAPAAKDIRVLSVSMTQPRMVNYPITVTAKIRNQGSEANPATVPLTYKKTTAPTSFGDAGGVSQTVSPSWSGDSATVTFTTPYTPTATGALKMYVRSFYGGDQAAANDSANASVTVNPDGLYFAEDFESTTFPPSGWSVADANGDGFTWSRKTVAPYTGSGHASYSYNTNNISVGADDWLFTLPVDLDASRAYSIIFQYRVKSAAYPERLEVTIGSQATPSGQTTQLLNFPNLTNTTYKQGAQAFAVSTSGTYYIGFHCYSNPFEWDLYVDSVRMRLTNNYDLAVNSLQQADGLAPAQLLNVQNAAGKQERSVYLLDAATQFPAAHVDELTPGYPQSRTASSPEVNASVLAVPTGSGSVVRKALVRNVDAFVKAPLPASVLLKAAVANVGSNDVTGYGVNWQVGGILQSPYAGGVVPRFSGVDTAQLNYAPSARGTFYTQVNSVLAQDNNRSNDSATLRTRVYPLVATTLKYDLGNSAAQVRVGYDRAVGQSLTGGVRFTATQDVKLANVDAFYTNKNSTGDTFQSQDSVRVRVWAAGVSDSAPGALLYSRKFAGQNYITTNPSGEAFSLPLGDDAPAFVSGSNYWVSISFDSLIRFPMGADAKTTGRSFISADNGATWSSLVIDAGNGAAEHSWWLRCVSIPLGSISGTKFDDTNGNGVRDAGEPGLSGWTINITGPASGSAVTDGSGNYSFTNLDGGTYTLTESQQPGWTQTLPAGFSPYTVAITTGGPAPGKDFGNFRLGSISGMKFNDLNADGIKDAGEPGISGWKIRLLRGAAQVDSVTTDVNGNYQFTNLPAGAYTVKEEFQSGWIQTFPASQESHAVAIVSGSAVTGRDFGNVQASGIAGILFRDLNANGIKDSAETGLSGWRIWLIRDSIHVDSMLTDGGGGYVFAGLTAGTYTVTESLQVNWIQSTPDSPGTHTVVLASGASASEKNFGNYQLGSIGGTAFRDFNGNGVLDGADPAISGWRIRLTGPKADSALTDAAGTFLFSGLKPGVYSIAEVPQSEWGQSYPISPASHAIALTSGSTVAGRNFGNYHVSSIAGTKFNDLNGNGVKDGGEPGVVGWLIRLSGAQSGSQSTDSSGNFLFANLRPGAYTVSEATRSTWDQTYPAAPGTHGFTITDSSTVTGKDFGNFQHGSISGSVFNDTDADAVKDSGEVGLSSWLIRLSKDGVQLDSATTGAGGAYSFTGLSAGTYVLSESVISGWTQSAPATPGTQTVFMTSGAAVTGANFGNFQRGSIAGTEFNDLNGNGVKEIGEAGLVGWLVRLSQGGVQKDSTLTNAAGTYAFSNLVPGTYVLSEAVQSGWVQTYPAAPGTHTVVVTGGGALSGKDFGNYSVGGVSGMAFEDVNGNGVKDAGDSAQSGWRIRIFKDGVRIDSTLTNAAGAYAFAGLAVGTYVVSEAVPSGWGQSLPVPSGTYTVVITSGASTSGKDFGNFRYGTISGSAFDDQNGDGVKDAGEPGLSGWRIRLYRNAQLVDSVLTPANGGFTFANVVPGTYTVSEALQNGWIETLPAAPGTYPLTVVSGTVSGGNNFGNFRLGSISGTKFEDTDGNGLKDVAEAGLSGWRIRLSLNGTQVDSALTDGSGGYTFGGLRVGTYVVSEGQQAGWAQSGPASPGTYAIPIVSGANATAMNFGNYRPGSISGMKFQDVNGNGVKDAGEGGLSGWRIRLVRAGAQVDSTLTDGSGNYAFAGLSPASYSIREAAQSGWVQTMPATPAGYAVTIASGVSASGQDFGNYQLGSISGTVFLDPDGSGVKTAGSGLPNWRVRLAKNGIPVDSALSDVNGAYAFSGLLTGTYTVSEALPGGWVTTFPAAPYTQTVLVTSGVAAVNQDFGNFQLGSISGTKFLDDNGNGLKDPAEPGLQNWRIRLVRGGTAVDSVLTGASGQYAFTSLTAGTYTVSEVQQSGWTQSAPPLPGTFAVTVLSGTAAAGEDFGNHQLASVSGTKYDDVNGNGTRDAGEPGLAGWQIRIAGASESSTLTDSTGAYAFSSLVPGTYVVSEVLTGGWLQTAPASPSTYTVALGSGAAAAGRDFGNFRLGSISGMKFEDLNTNGVKDAGEPGIPGWRIRLHRGATFVDSVLTDASGFYQFSGLAGGAYTVSEAGQGGWEQTFPALPGTYTVGITSGAASAGNDFGNYQYGTVSGQTFLDLNGNGLKDGGEAGLGGWRLRLAKGGLQVDSVLSDGSGNYFFTKLSEGTYTVSEAVQSGWMQTTAPASYQLNVIKGTNAVNNDFGNFQLGAISGNVYNDANSNGILDGGEAGLQNWRIRLRRSGVQVDSALTDENGNYAFAGVTAGSYTVSEKKQTSWSQTSSPTSYALTVTSGTASANNNFGNFQTGFSSDLTLELTVLLEGFYQNATNTMVPDTVLVELHSVTSPFETIDQDTLVLNEHGQGDGTFSVADNGIPYYIVVKHRNSIETWSAAGQTFVASFLAYDFTTAANKAYGSNMVQKGTRWCLYSGDCEKDGWVDGLDLNRIDNDAANFSYGYNLSDVNGDGWTDGLDMNIVENNSARFIYAVTPASSTNTNPIRDAEQRKNSLKPQQKK
jgi:protocatechuate 3,4-dioxygenase beta subunit